MRKFFSVIFFLFIVLILYNFFIYKKPIPIFEAVDLNQNVISANSLKNKVILINFWYPSCPGCFKEMPKLNDLYTKYKNSDFKLIGISANYNSLDQVKEYIKLRGINFDIIYDKENLLLNKFEVNVVPTIFLVSKKGYIYNSYIGSSDSETLEKNIQYLLNK